MGIDPNTSKFHFLDSMVTPFSEIKDDEKENTKMNPKKAGLVQTDSFYENWAYIGRTWYYHKYAKNLNEFIGEILADNLDVPTAHYEPAYRSGKLMIRTPDFRVPNHTYMTLYQLQPKYKQTTFEDFISLLNLDRENILNVLKMFAIDIYMRQPDRSNVNILFKIHKGTKKVSFAKIFDYTNGFDRDYRVYDNAILSMEMTREDVYKKLSNFPEFFSYLDTLSHLDMLKLLRSWCLRYGFNITKEIDDYYQKEDEISKQIIKEIR